ncbi:peptidoglycan-recognition protein LB-like [Pectinophora gossypiella]|uniref:peptidoglycan-recognition protein LB-like n=1 Tax=Pectinophora gossypiella TaxID=13191 RepID=UPI00214F49F5|nr:peptidoglycan-recognition protein LB-like [Pectinophora gossypiella]
MVNKIVFVAFLMLACAVDLYSCIPVSRNDPVIVTRAQWGAQPARGFTNLNTPVPLVVIHHSSVPGACFNQNACSQAMRSMQNTHQNVNGWVDIGYNFAVGSDGLVYEGRGWNRVGAHAAPHNSNSIGIVLIGHWVSATPPALQLQTTQRLIALGVRLGFIRPQYSLIGHRQVSATECPGQALFNQISRWPNFTPNFQFEENDV